MNDLIDRQAAIDVLNKHSVMFEFHLPHEFHEVKEEIRGLPSAQPTQTNAPNALKSLDCISRQAAINALEFGITYAKAVNRETGEVTELFKQSNDELKKAIERIQKLPTAEPRCYLGSPCEYQNAEIRLPTAEPKTGRWIPVSERLPEDVLCGTLVTDGINVWVETWVGIVGKWKYNHSTITAWMPLPEAWKGEEDGRSD